jgi:hypothetical protein
MRKTVFLLSVLAAISIGSVRAERIDLDLHDYDDELMRTLDQTIKYFEPDIVAGNVQGAMEDAGILRDGFKWMENYFSRKENAERAVQFSRESQEFVAAAVKSLAENDLDNAAEAARSTARTCRACHDIYKPLKAR